VVENVTKGVTFQANPLPPFMKEILDAGGLMPWVARSMASGGAAPKVTVPANEPPQADWRLD
jgi:3-isopropylmalate/(R)-2-methylmalate dehydratase small subunit